MHHTQTSTAVTLSLHTSPLSWLNLFASLLIAHICQSHFLPFATSSSLCISNVITPQPPACAHVDAPPLDVVLLHPPLPFQLLTPRPGDSHCYPDWSSLLILALNVAARLSLSAPVLLLLCDVNEAFWFVIKRWPRDTERLINQDKASGEPWYTAKHQPSS